MIKNKLSFKEAIKSQLLYCLSAVLFLILLGYIFYPVNTLSKQLVLVAVSLGAAVLTAIKVRRAANRVVCEACDTNLYELIENAKSERIEVQYCPKCGYKFDT
jgi:hypothetical protein